MTTMTATPQVTRMVDLVLFVERDRARMVRRRHAIERRRLLKVPRFRMRGDEGVLVLEQHTDDVMNEIVAELRRRDEQVLDADGAKVLVETTVRAGRNDRDAVEVFTEVSLKNRRQFVARQ